MQGLTTFKTHVLACIKKLGPIVEPRSCNFGTLIEYNPREITRRELEEAAERMFADLPGCVILQNYEHQDPAMECLRVTYEAMLVNTKL
jgi:hypothetical protein